MNTLNTQVGGSHYKNMTIQPVEFIERNNLGFCVGNIIKYICRYKYKNGVEDLKKAKHYIDILIDFESECTNTDENDESQSPLVPQASADIQATSSDYTCLTDIIGNDYLPCFNYKNVESMNVTNCDISLDELEQINRNEYNNSYSSNDGVCSSTY